MAYEKINWKDGESGNTPLSAENLNKMDSGIELAHSLIASFIEKGSNSDGTWIKFADGTMICHGSKTIENITISTSWGAMYESSVKYDFGTFPIAFKSPPSIYIGQKEGQTVLLQTLGNSTTETELGKTWLYSPVTRENTVCEFFYIAIGEWE